MGRYTDIGGTRHGFLLDIDGSYTTIDPPGSTYTDANGINDASQIVGEYGDFGTITFRGFLRDVDGSYTIFDVPGARDTKAYGINDAGQIVGYYTDAPGTIHGFLAIPGG